MRHIVVAHAVVDPEDEAARRAADAAAAEAAAVASMGAVSNSALLQRVADRNKAQQLAALMKRRLTFRGYRLLYTWSRDVSTFTGGCHFTVEDYEVGVGRLQGMTRGGGGGQRQIVVLADSPLTPQFNALTCVTSQNSFASLHECGFRGFRVNKVLNGKRGKAQP